MMTFFKVRFIRSFLRRLAESNDTRTTVLGLTAAALLASNIDWGLLLKGDPDQVGTLAGVVVAVLFGYLTNKPDGKKK